MKRIAEYTLLGLLALHARVHADVPATDDTEMGRRLQEELRDHGGDVHGCYSAALAERPTLRGELLVRLHILPGGKVEHADVLKDQVGSGRLTICLVDAMRSWRVPRLAGDATQQVVFPLAFKPDETAPPVSAIAPPRVVVPFAEGKPGPLAGGRLEARVLIDESTVGQTAASLTRLTVKPSARLSLHRHPGAIEVLYVLKGRAHVRSEAARAVVSAETGDVILSDADVAHSIESAPLAPLEVAQFYIPSGPERAYRDSRSREGTVAAMKNKSPTSRPPMVIRAAALRTNPILGGKGSATLFLDGQTDKVSVQRLEAAAGAEIPRHVHDHSDELLFVISGRGAMFVAGHSYDVGAGDGVRIPKATEHSLKVLDKLVAVQCYAPGGPEQRFKPPREATPR